MHTFADKQRITFGNELAFLLWLQKGKKDKLGTEMIFIDFNHYWRRSRLWPCLLALKPS